MYCRKCGKEVPTGSNFCPNCGASQKEATFGLKNWVIEFYHNHKITSIIYFLWLVLHIFLFLSANTRESTYRTYRVVRISAEDVKAAFFPFNEYGVDSYDASELFFYTIIFPFIIFGLYKLLSYIYLRIRRMVSLIFNRKKCNSQLCHVTNERGGGNAKDNINEVSPIGGVIEGDNLKEDILIVSDNTEEETTTEYNRETEIMPLSRRFLGSMIDKIVLLVLFFLTSIINPLLKSGDLGGYIAILNKSPYDYRIYEQLGITTYGFEALDSRVTFSFILFNILYYVLFESIKKASLGKNFLGGVLIDKSSDVIDFGKALSRGLWGGFMMISFYFLFHLAMGLNLYIVFCLFFLIMDLPVFFTKRSLLDICTRTFYVKRAQCA